MPKPILQLSNHIKNHNENSSNIDSRSSALSELVRQHLRAHEMRQVDFCRQTGFDQGLLSKILSSVVTTLNVETALKLSNALGLPPSVVFESIGKKEVDDLLRKFYNGSGKIM